MLDIIVNENWITFAHNEEELDKVTSVTINSSGMIRVDGTDRRFPFLHSSLLDKVNNKTRCSFVRVKGWAVLSNRELPFIYHD